MILEDHELDALADALAERLLKRLRTEPEFDNVTPLPQYVGWDELGRECGGAKKRWLEARVADGMPSYLRAGRRVFKLEEAVAWLKKNGHLTRDAA